MLPTDLINELGTWKDLKVVPGCLINVFFVISIYYMQGENNYVLWGGGQKIIEKHWARGRHIITR